MTHFVWMWKCKFQPVSTVSDLRMKRNSDSNLYFVYTYKAQDPDEIKVEVYKATMKKEDIVLSICKLFNSKKERLKDLLLHTG